MEANFRTLDRKLRERIAGFGGGKGELLEVVLGDRDGITDSDQGRSFQAFYDFLLSPQRPGELGELLRRIEAIEDPDPRLRTVHYDWLDAGERTQATVRLPSDQLRMSLNVHPRVGRGSTGGRSAISTTSSAAACSSRSTPRTGSAGRSTSTATSSRSPGRSVRLEQERISYALVERAITGSVQRCG